MGKIITEPPVAIILTLPVQFFKERQMDEESFKKYFERLMRKEDMLWNFRLTNLPTHDVAWVYFNFFGKVHYRLNLVMYQRNAAKSFNDTPDGITRDFDASNWVICTGPVVPAPYEISMKGFQGFRYSKQIF